MVTRLGYGQLLSFIIEIIIIEVLHIYVYVSVQIETPPFDLVLFIQPQKKDVYF